jgi:hypothetical protein
LSLLAFASFFLSTLDSLTVLVISSRFSHAAALNAPTEDSAMTNQLGRASAPPSSVDLCLWASSPVGLVGERVVLPGGVDVELRVRERLEQMHHWPDHIHGGRSLSGWLTAQLKRA